MLAGVRKFEQSYEDFDSRNASEAHLAFAEGDMSTNKVRACLLPPTQRFPLLLPCHRGESLTRYCSQFTKFYNYLLNVSIVTRWILFIVPVMGLVWIPGILGFTKFPDAKVSTRLHR